MPKHTPPILVFALALVFVLSPGLAHAADHWVEVRSPHFTVDSNAGEKEARRIANQFEEIRNVFTEAFPKLRVEAGKPLIILALKNEDSMKALLPDFWNNKDRARPAGLYYAGFDRDFAVLRTDVTGSAENEYHSLYHEYTHGILRLNFTTLPVWLNEGLAEFFGNTVVHRDEIDLGTISSAQLRILQKSAFIPIQTLANVDQRSPLYNERDRVSMFYAESWLLVHFLMVDPDAKKEQLLLHFFDALAKTNDSEEAAKQSFGDLNRFEGRLRLYSQQSFFHFLRLKPQSVAAEKDYSAREMTPAEVLTAQGDFLEHSGHGKEGYAMLKQAIDQQPALAAAYSDAAYYEFYQHDNEATEALLDKAIALDPQDYRAYYYKADLIYRKSGYRAETTSTIIGYLEKVIKINPDFPPAWAFLANAYCRDEANRAKSFDAAVTAMKLAPANFGYKIILGDTLIALKREKEAHQWHDRLAKVAVSPAEKSQLESFEQRLSHRDDSMGKEQVRDTVEPSKQTSETGESSRGTPESEKASTADSPGREQSFMADGVFREVRCNGTNGVSVRFAILGETLSLASASFSRIEFRKAGQASTASENPCEQWKDRKAKLTYRSGSDATAAKEILAIDFF